jgi:hypothetical protein
MNKIFISVVLLSTSILAQNFILNINGQDKKEKINLELNLKVDSNNKLIGGQKIDYLDNKSLVKSLKIITTNGLKSTLVDEREIIVFYKTSLKTDDLKIKNLYKIGNARVYNNDTDINITFDKDYYQDITSYLKYHNVKDKNIKDLDNIYGFWYEIDAKYTSAKITNENKQLKISKNKFIDITEISKID